MQINCIDISLELAKSVYLTILLYSLVFAIHSFAGHKIITSTQCAVTSGMPLENQ